MTATLDRLSDIASQIRGVVSGVSDADNAKTEAQEMFQDSVTGATNARENTMVSLALLSASGSWTDSEINSAIAMAKKMGNTETKKATETFMGEAARAMHPNVRDYVPGIFALREQAWNEEAELTKATNGEAAAPLKKAFSRKYHLLLAMFGEAKELRYLRTVPDVVRFCEARDPDLNSARQVKALTRIIADLQTIYGNFPDDDLKAAMDVLAPITKEALDQARDILLRSFGGTRALPDATPTVAEDSNHIQAEAPEDAESAIISNNHTTDILDDVLGDLAIAA